MATHYFNEGNLYINYGTKDQKLIGKVSKSKKQYLFLDYRDEFGEKYENDVDLLLEKNALEKFENEINYLKEKAIKIIEIDKEYGSLVIEDNNFTEIPYKKLQPWSHVCSKDGSICEFCHDKSCCDYKTCNSEYKYIHKEIIKTDVSYYSKFVEKMNKEIDK